MNLLLINKEVSIMNEEVKYNGSSQEIEYKMKQRFIHNHFGGYGEYKNNFIKDIEIIYQKGERNMKVSDIELVDVADFLEGMAKILRSLS